MVTPQIWEGQLGLNWDDNLCLDCLEVRLGRKLVVEDILTFPSYPGMRPISDRLMARYREMGFKMAAEHRADEAVPRKRRRQRAAAKATTAR